MYRFDFVKLTSTAVLLYLTTAAASVQAHTAGGPIDSNSNNASATDLAFISCYDDGNGPADSLFVQIEDLSPPVPGLLLSVQLRKQNQMTNTTDQTSADGKASAAAVLKGGNGDYFVSITKTAAGIRNFQINYHCETATRAHTGTELGGILQIQ